MALIAAEEFNRTNCELCRTQGGLTITRAEKRMQIGPFRGGELKSRAGRTFWIEATGKFARNFRELRRAVSVWKIQRMTIEAPGCLHKLSASRDLFWSRCSGGAICLLQEEAGDRFRFCAGKLEIRHWI